MSFNCTCGKNYAREGNLTIHQGKCSVHIGAQAGLGDGKEVPHNPSKNLTEEVFKCECGKVCKSAAGLKIHKKGCKGNGAGTAAAAPPKKNETPKKATTPAKTKTAKGRAVPPVSNATPPPPSKPKMVDVGLGSQVKLEGQVHYQDPKTQQWTQAQGSGIVVEVYERTANDDGMFLMMKDAHGQVFAVLEATVLKTPEMVVYHVPANPGLPVPPAATDPEPEPEIPDPTPGQDAQAEFQKAKADYEDALICFVDARDAKLAAEKEMKAATKENRPLIEAYLKDYGQESEEGKQDFQVVDFGYKALLARTPGKAGVDRDDEKCIAWCRANGHTECLKTALDVKVWSAMAQAGHIPAEFIQQVEKPTLGKDTFALRITDDDTEEEE